MAINPVDFLLEDYKQKIGYLTNHLQRMWTRFNFFVTIESALIGGKFLISSNVLSQELAWAGVVLSALWYVMGAQDRFLAKLYRWQVEQAARRVIGEVWPNPKVESYDHVGCVDQDIVERFRRYEQEAFNKSHPFRWLEQLLESVSAWRVQQFSTTHLAAFFPLFVLGLWVLALVPSEPLP